MNNDFAQYRPYLLQYLSLQGIDVSKNPTRCFSPDHKNSNGKSLTVYDNNFKCMSCGISGDIFDAVEILQRESSKKEQLKIVQACFPVGFSPLPSTKNKKGFEASPSAEKALFKYLNEHPQKVDGVTNYLKQRGYSEELLEKYRSFFGWWPGIPAAHNDCGKKILFSAGVPAENPTTRQYSWEHPGAAVKIGNGFKYFFYKESKKGLESQKVGTKKCQTFPFPSLPATEEIFLVEGELSAISMRVVGYENTSATGGVSALTKPSCLKLLPYKKITIVFDGDKAGRSAVDPKHKNNMFDKLKRVDFKGEIFIAALPDGKDPDDLVKEGKTTALKSCIDTAVKFDFVGYDAAPEDENPNLTAPFIFLGYDESAYYFMPQSQNIPLRIARGNTSIKNNLEELASFGWWFLNFTKEKNDKDYMFDVTSASTWVRQESYKKGVFDPEKILGVGIHDDNGDFVVNTGKSLMLYRSGKEIKYEQYVGELVFSRSKNIMSIPAVGWSMDERINFVKQLSTFTFDRVLDRVVVAGFVAVAPYASMLERRPHIWLSAQRGAGKTFLLDTIVSPGLGKHSLRVEGRTTEPGIRQSIGKDCRPVIIDEFEANNKRDAATIENILALARSAYGGWEIAKGSAGHEAIKFNTKMMFCFASIKTLLSNAANASRIAVVRMKPSTGRMTNIPEMGGLRRMMYERLPELLSNIAIAKKCILEGGFDDRTADTYSPLLAGYWMIISDDPFLQGVKSHNEKMMNAILEIAKEDRDDDETTVLNYILQHTVMLSHGNHKSIAEMLVQKKKMDPSVLQFDEDLRRIGIRRTRYSIEGEKRDVIAISVNHQELKKILDETAFSEYSEVLSRHPAFLEGGKKRKHPLVRMSGKTERCLLLDWGMISEDYIGTPDEEETAATERIVEEVF